MIEYLILYAISVVVCFPAYVYEHAWVKGHDIYFGTFVAMFLIALMPVMNLIILSWILDLSWLENKLNFVVVKGREK